MYVVLLNYLELLFERSRYRFFRLDFTKVSLAIIYSIIRFIFLAIRFSIASRSRVSLISLDSSDTFVFEKIIYRLASIRASISSYTTIISSLKLVLIEVKLYLSTFATINILDLRYRVSIRSF